MRLMTGVIVSRRTNAQENLKSVTRSAAIIAVELAWPEIESELTAESDVDVAAVGKIAHVTDRDCVDRENLVEISGREDKFVSRFFDVFPTRVNGVAFALIIRFEQYRFGFSFVGIVVLAPDQRCRP